MSEFQIISLLIMRENMLFSGEIYTAGKIFTLPPAMTALTNSHSDPYNQFWSIIVMWICEPEILEKCFFSGTPCTSANVSG